MEGGKGQVTHVKYCLYIYTKMPCFIKLFGLEVDKEIFGLVVVIGFDLGTTAIATVMCRGPFRK